jgi:hypothetical protein
VDFGSGLYRSKYFVIKLCCSDTDEDDFVQARIVVTYRVFYFISYA